MATLVYLGLWAYARSKSITTSVVPEISNIENELTSTDSSILKSESSSIGDDDDYADLFSHADASNSILDDTTSPKDAVQSAEVETVSIKSSDENQQVINIDTPSVLCIRLRESVINNKTNTNLKININKDCHTIHVTTQEKRMPTTPTKIHVPPLQGQDDLVICHTTEVLLLVRIPVSTEPLSELEKWIKNIIAALTKWSWIRKSSIAVNATGAPTETKFEDGSNIYHACIISSNTAVQDGEQNGRRAGYSVLQGHLTSVHDVFDAFFKYKYSGPARTVPEDLTMLEMNVHTESEVEVLYSRQGKGGDVSISFKGAVELEKLV